MISLQSQPGTLPHRHARQHDGMADPLVARLTVLASLSADDRAALAQLASREAMAGAHADLVRDGEAAETAFLVMEGIACRYLQTAAGPRQILTLLLPGDLCDLDLIHLERWDHGVATLSPCRVVRVPRAVLEDLLVTHSTVKVALRRAKLEAEARSRGWLTALGVRSAAERLAYLFCEIVDRQHAIGMAERDACSLPLTQVDLAECVGVTIVHVNRTLRELRSLDLIELKDRHLRILNRAGLEALAGR
ncbi:Crp/Fnr family transcriptional regulator [Methylorubrum sp. SB2]|uniref:Crp/Fnr family transcriptional regulator n=1 Tax=Methylorubrum subtropicum TaxID=3138812 RepID=UPI00313F28A8